MSPRAQGAAGARRARDGLTLVLYDGGCPLCRREISHYRRLDRSGAVVWIDILTETQTLTELGVEPGRAMERIHVRDGDGIWRTGAYGFVALWSRLPYYRLLAGLVRSLGLTPLLERLYSPFARWRLDRRCRAQCEAPSSDADQGGSA